MRRSRKALEILTVVAIGWLGATSAFAAVGSKSQANINEGNVGISASFSFTEDYPEIGDSFSTLRFTERFHYFLMDHLGVGLTFRVLHEDNFTDLTVGPTAEYYFWTQDKLGAYVAEDVLVRNINNTGTNSSAPALDTIVGVNYFITPSVAVGPAIDFFHRFGTSTLQRLNEFSFEAFFSVYL